MGTVRLSRTELASILEFVDKFPTNHMHVEIETESTGIGNIVTASVSDFLLNGMSVTVTKDFTDITNW